MRRLLIIGCGDIGMRLVPLLRDRYRIYALSRTPENFPTLRRMGVIPIPGDLDRLETLNGLAGLAQDVVHLAPPPGSGSRDTRTTHLIAALARSEQPAQQVVYISTSGVYGDCAGDVVSETRPARPGTDRARRRVDAERQLRVLGRRSGVRITLLRVPGIYAADRLPIARLQRGTPAIRTEEDSYVNHVHADDLSRMVVAALFRGHPNRSYNAVDDEPQKMGDYFDLVADRSGLPRPPRIPRSEADVILPAMLRSFMSESRRLSNARIKRELRLRLRYPTVRHGVPLAASSMSEDVA